MHMCLMYSFCEKQPKRVTWSMCVAGSWLHCVATMIILVAEYPCVQCTEHDSRGLPPILEHIKGH